MKLPPDIIANQAGIDAVHNAIFGERVAKRQAYAQRGPAAPVNASDEELIEKASMASSRFASLYRDGWQGDDQSAQDMWLCSRLAFWTGRDPARMDRIFRSSALMREKWNRADYREPTMNKAITECSETYNPKVRVGMDDQQYKNPFTADAKPMLRMVASPGASKHTSIEAPPAGKSHTPPRFSEDALGVQLVDRYHLKIRYVADQKDWYVFDGAAWRSDQKLGVFDFARKICRAASAEAIATQMKEGFARALTSAKARYSVTSQASIDQRIVMLFDEFDSDPLLLGTPGGVVDLRTGELRPATPQDYISKLTAVTPAPAGTVAHTWLKVLASTFPKRHDLTQPDTDLIAFIQRWFGYSLTGLTKEQKFLFGYGSGGNGKNTTFEQLLGILRDYAVTLPAEVLLQRPFDPHRAELMPLRGARMIFVDEVPDGATWNQARLTGITGGGKLRANAMRSDTVEFVVTGKLTLIATSLPRFTSQNVAAKRRIQLLNFWMHFRHSEEEQGGDPERTKLGDNDLGAKLKAEWPAILRWAIDGCLEWQKHGLGAPELVRAESLDSVESDDLFIEWRAEKCRDLLKSDGKTVDYTREGVDLVSLMNKSYNQFREPRKEPPLSGNAFRDVLNSHDVVTKKRPRVTYGFQLTDAERDRINPPSNSYGGSGHD